MKKWFVGDRGVRPGWRFVLFVAALILVAQIVQWFVFVALRYKEPEGWTPEGFISLETAFCFTTLVAMVVMRWIERGRWSFADYGAPLRSLFGKHFWNGALWGFLMPTALVLLIAAFGGAEIRGPALDGSRLAASAGMWLIAMLLLGLSEEFAFRGYPLFSLSDAIGFWPAAAALSVLFGGLHYFSKPMETWLDATSVGLIGLLLCLSIRRTGSLWFAVGFHMMFDFAALVLYAAPNTGNQGQSVSGHLLDVAYHGPAWLTGGPCGMEASALIFPLLAAAFFVMNRMYPAALYPSTETGIPAVEAPTR